MKEILKILKKHFAKIMFVIVLLILLANCDLSLPSYTSNIVNIGIQQNGIEYVTPVVFRETTFNKISMYLEDDSVKDSYELISKDTLSKEKYNEYIELYPSLKKENLYILKDTSNNNLKKLEDKIKLPIVINEFINQALASGNMGDATTNLGDIKELDGYKQTMESKLDQMGDSLIEQYAINSVKNEYSAIGFNLEKTQMNYIVKTGLKMLGLTLLSALITIINSYVISKISAQFSMELRNKVVNKVMNFSNKEFEDFSASSLITRTTNDVQQVQMLITMGLRTIVLAPIMGIGAFLKVRNSSMSWVILVALAAIFAVIMILFFVAVPNFKKVQALLDKVNLIAREILTGLPVIRAFSTEKYEEKRFDKANLNLTKVNLFVNKVMSVMMPTMMFIMNAVNILIIWIGADKINKASIQVGDLMAFIQYSVQIIMSFLMISILSIMLPRAIVSIKRITEVLNKENSIKDPENPKKFKKDVKGKVEFKNVSFRYPDANENVLSNVSFTVDKGQTIAFIGSTGSGKSTLANLVVRFFDVTEGEILIDDINIKDVTLKELRDKIGFVPQKGILFSGTIESNIKFADSNIDDEQMKKAAEVSQVLETIESKELKYKSNISQGGTNVSGGQKQRLAIARAVAKNPEIYIFDDSFSALDFKTDANLRKALKQYTKDSTILIVAQRISSIMYADKIVVLDQGEVVGIGTHKELLKNCDVYKEISVSQLGEEVINNVG